MTYNAKPYGHVQGNEVYTWDEVERELLARCESPRWELHCGECAACDNSPFVSGYDGNPGVWYRIAALEALTH